MKSTRAELVSIQALCPASAAASAFALTLSSVTAVVGWANANRFINNRMNVPVSTTHGRRRQGFANKLPIAYPPIAKERSGRCTRDSSPGLSRLVEQAQEPVM